MANLDGNYYGADASDYRDTKEFAAFVETVFSEIKRLGKNAKFATLSGQNAKFYKVAGKFGLAIAKLIADKRITMYLKDGAKHFRVGALVVEQRKPLPKEVSAMADWGSELTRRTVRKY